MFSKMRALATSGLPARSALARLLPGSADGVCCALSFAMPRKAMVSRIRKVPSFDLAVFGGTGDLAHRKLFPALFHRFLDGQFSQPTKIIGVARRPLDQPAYRGTIAGALKEFAAARDEAISGFLELIHYVSLDIDSEAGWDLLGKRLDADPSRVRAFYLATNPDHFAPIAKRL